jgi:hypothetical protein
LRKTTTPRRAISPRPQQGREDRSASRELPLEGAPEGHDPAAGDIGYWAPGGDLVFYYDATPVLSTASSGSRGRSRS